MRSVASTTAHFGLVVSQIAGRFRDEQARESHAPTGASHIVQAGAGVEVMAAAGASVDGGSVTMAAVGKGVAAETDDQGRVHGDLRRVIGSG
jgi:hypothetical protein